MGFVTQLRDFSVILVLLAVKSAFDCAEAVPRSTRAPMSNANVIVIAIFLKSRSPFLASESLSQGTLKNVADYMKRYFVQQAIILR
jgi:hypothetical protein